MATDPRLVRPKWRNRTNVDAFTIACIEHAEALVRKRAPKIAHPFKVTKGSYQPTGGTTTSGTTHDRGGAVDLEWCGHWVCYVALRDAGMFIWHRTPEQGPWDDHYHGAPIGHPDMSPSLQRQQTAYFNRRDGLKNNGPDTGPRLDPIPRPVWPWPQEEDMPSAKEVVDELLARKMKVKRGENKVEVSFEQMLVETFNRAQRIDYDRIAKAVTSNLGGLVTSELSAEALEAAVRDGVETVLREGIGE